MKKLVLSACMLGLSLCSAQGLAATATSHHTQAVSNKAAMKDTVTVHFFWSHDCPHCVAAHPFLDKLKTEYPWLKVHSYEISTNSHNSKLFEKMAKDHGKETSFVPTFFIGDKMIVGYSGAKTTGAQIRDAIKEAHDHK